MASEQRQTTSKTNSMWRPSKTEHRAAGDASFEHDAIFEKIRLLVENNATFDEGLKAWVRWILNPPSDLQCKGEYFDVLVQAFLKADSSSHIKYCLAILRASIPLLPRPSDTFFERPAHEPVVFEYESDPEYGLYITWDWNFSIGDYCHIFEIMALGRYINQVLDCLKSLPTKSDPKRSHRLGAVPPLWWTILFRTVMASNNESVKKVVGSWIMDNWAVDITGHYARYARGGVVVRAYLDVMLAWACNGQLAFKTIVRERRNVRSGHAEQLALWGTALALKLGLEEYVLSWLCIRVNILNQHTTVYLIAGLLQDRPAEPTPRLSFDAAVRIASGANFSPLCRFITRKLCLRILEDYDLRSKHHGSDESDDTVVSTHEVPFPFLTGSSAIKKLRHELQASRDITTGDMGIFLSQATSDPSEEKIRARKAFATFVDSKYVEVHGNNLSIDWDRLTRYDPHQALWRHLAESWPHWLHDMPDDTPGVCRNKLDFAADCVVNFFRLARKKTYLWVPTARALHGLYFGDMPKIVRHKSVEEVLLGFVNEPPRPTPEHLLDVAVAQFVSQKEDKSTTADVYEFQANETLGHVYIFDILNRLRSEDRLWATQTIDKLLDPYLKQQLPIPVTSKWKRTSQLQAMLVLLPICTSVESEELGYIGAGEDASTTGTNENISITEDESGALSAHGNRRKYLTTFQHLLAHDPNPRNRFLLEWAILYLCLSDVRSSANQFMHLLETADAANPNPKEVASWIKIAVQLVLYDPASTNNDERIRPFERLLTILTTLINSSRVPVRFEAQASLTVVYEYAAEKGYLPSIPGAAVFTSVYTFVTKLDKYINPPESRVLGVFDVKRDMNLATLFEGGYLFIPQEETPLLYAQDLREVEKSTPTLEAFRPRIPIGRVDAGALALIQKSMEKSKKATDPGETSSSSPVPLQTKSLALDLASLDISESDKRLANAGTGPILVGSLLDAPVNVGGLSRAANVFGCHSLHISSMSILSDRSFKSVSVDSELALSVVETPVSELVSRLLTLKQEGWTIVGLEQTSNSITIGIPDTDSGRLPQKSVIIMGTEATGIPAEVLLQCDVCIEIKQWGVTRSLNVQTAAACILFEWRRQWGAGAG